MPDAYAAQLTNRYGESISYQIAGSALRSALLPHQTGEFIDFVEVEPDTPALEHKKVLLVPGFGVGIINKASLAAELAAQGRHAILPGQNRHGILKDETGRANPTYTQARNYLAIMDAAASGPVDVVTNSYGSLVFDEMVRLEPDRFKESDVVMLAPAGSIRGQRLPAMGRQWLRMMKSESNRDRPMEFPDPNNDTGRASAKVLLANIPRTVREIGDLWRRTVDYGRLSRSVGSLVVLSYAEDYMYPEEKLSPMLSAAVEAGYITWATPVSPDRVVSGEMAYAGEGAVHDDEQYNPSRVVSAALQLLG